MSFLNTGALWGLFLIIIPIVIHLFDFRRVKRLYFSNVSFLTNVKSQSNSKNVLRKLLILFMRILAIVFLVFAFSQPYLVSNNQLEGAQNEVFYLDNSFSMGRTSLGYNDLISDGINLMNQLSSNYPDNYSIGLVTNEFEKNNRTLYKRELGDRLSEIGLTNRGVDLMSIKSRINRINENSEKIYFLSDFQMSSFKDLSDFLDDSLKNYRLIKLESEIQSNLFIDSLFLENPIGLLNENRIHFSIKNSGPDNFSETLIKVYKGERQISSFLENFTGNSTKWLEVDLSGSGELQGNYIIEIEEGQFPFDNQYYFVIDEFVRPKIYQIYENEPNHYLKTVYSNNTYFDFTASSVNRIKADDLLNSDLILIDGLRSIPSWFVSFLDNYKNNVLLIPSDKLDLNSYISFLGSGVKIANDTTLYNVSFSSLQHPYFNSVFNQKNNETNLPWMKIKLDITNPSDVVLKSKTGKPLMYEVKSNLYVIGGPIDDTNTNLHKHGIFLPLMYKLSMDDKNDSQLSYIIGDAVIPVENDSLMLNSNVLLESDKVQIVPIVRSVNGKLSLEIPSILEGPGFYRLIRNKDTLKTFAFNLSKKESDLKELSDDEILKMISGKKNVTFESVENVDEYIEKTSAQNDGLPLWKYALLLALAFLITELTLLRVFR